MCVNDRHKAWTLGEDDLIRAQYPLLAASGMLKRGYLADRTGPAINRRAYVLGVKYAKHTEMMEAFETPWPVPTHDLMESLACVQLRKWRYPVERGPLVPNLGMNVPGLGMAA